MRTMLLALLAVLPAALAAQDESDPAATPVKTEVREAALFKDGHAFVVAEAMAPPRSGWVVTLDVPEAILGTLWVFSPNPKARVETVRAGFEVVDVKKPCLTLLDSIEAALGQDVLLTLSDAGAQPRTLEGTIVDLPKLAPERFTADAPAEFILGEVLHVRTASGLEIVRKSSVLSIKCKKEFPVEKTVRTVRRRILVKTAVEPGVTDPVPLRFVYVQKGLRWIPEYRVELLADKKARIALQATIVNDLTDLKDVAASLVVGIPNFTMKESLSPLALREAAGRIAPHLQYANQFHSNAVSTQIASYGEPRPGAAPDATLDVLAKGSSADEYFLYTLPRVTIRKGERSGTPLFEGTFAYENVYTLMVPPVAPRFIAMERSDELRHALQSPKVLHGLRLRNAGTVPWTTGPALIVRDGRALSQDILRFTPIGGHVVLPMAELADVAVRTRDVEQNRFVNIRIDGTDYTQVFMRGTLCLVSHRKEPLPVEIDRIFFGQVDKVQDGGTAEAFDFAALPGGRYSAASWPHWWMSVNGMFETKWKAALENGKPAEFTVDWSYFRR